MKDLSGIKNIEIVVEKSFFCDECIGEGICANRYIFKMEI